MTQTSPIDQMTGNRLVFEDSVEVQGPINEVYQRWTDFPRFPDFMNQVQEVRPLGDDRYHWVARIFGNKQEWDTVTTDRDLNRRISWRSTTGPYNAGTVSFSSLGNNETEVRLRMEYTPPGGTMGQALDKTTHMTRREVREGLKNFKDLVEGKKLPKNQRNALAQIGAATQGLTNQTVTGITPVLGPLAVPAIATAAGGVAAFIIGRRQRHNPRYIAYTSPVAMPNAVSGWALTGASAASILGAAALRSQGKAVDGLFVGQWAPTLLGMGMLARLLGHRNVQTNLPVSVASWSFASACLGSIIASATLHARGKREEGLFVGQWAPTFLAGALITRLFNRVIR
jgi:uncharacterized membrane protein